MTRSRKSDPKVEALRVQATLHRHPERVAAPLFLGSDFFDARDLLQVKYEMLRRVDVDHWAIAAAAREFGFSRVSFYEARGAFAREGLGGLVPRKRGPRGPRKLTPEVMRYLVQRREREPRVKGPALGSAVERQFGVVVHPRTIERALRGRKKKRQAPVRRRGRGHPRAKR